MANNIRKQIEHYLSKFPVDATCWSKATDEVKDLACWSRECLEDHEGIIINSIDFYSLQSPSSWNSTAREYILNNFDRMSESTQEAFYNRYLVLLTPGMLEEVEKTSNNDLNLMVYR